MTSVHRLRFAFDIASPTGVCDCKNRLRSDGEKGRVRFASETFYWIRSHWKPYVQGIMPNTGQLFGQSWKCEKCRKDFKAVWLPTNVCCRISSWDQQPGILTQAPYSRHVSDALKEAASKSFASSTTEYSTKSSNGRHTQKIPGIPVQSLAVPWMRHVNRLAPFSTSGKSTCGYYFSRDTDNNKRKTGIPPSDLVAWRSNIS